MSDLYNKILQCKESLDEGFYPEDIAYDLQAVNWVHKELTNILEDIINGQEDDHNE